MLDIKSFPIQKLPAKKKTEQWKKDCVNYIIGAGNVGIYGFNTERTSEMQTYYDLYNSIYNEKDLKQRHNQQQD